MFVIKLVDWLRLKVCLFTSYATKRTKVLFSEASESAIARYHRGMVADPFSSI